MVGDWGTGLMDGSERMRIRKEEVEEEGEEKSRK